MDRVDGLVALNQKLSKRGRPSRELHDILRAATVLSLAALDAVVVDAIVDAVPEACRNGKLGDRVAKWIADDGANALAMFAQPSPHKAVRDLVRAKMIGVTLQRTAMIDDNLRSILNVDPSWHIAASTIDPLMSADQLKQHLNPFSDRRNQIAHRGDVKHGTRSPEVINREWVHRHVGYVRVVGEMICDDIQKTHGVKRGRRAKVK